MQRIRLVNRSGATLDIVNVRVLISDNQRSFELSHVFGVYSEICLKRDIYLYTLGDVDERPSGPNSCVEGGKLIVAGWDHSPEVFFKDLRVLT